jgi:endonuclease/exonuclease/phosphatase family metal-dependent hydrolase
MAHRYRTIAWMAALAIAGCGAPARVARLPCEGEHALRVLTWNVNYGLAGDPSVVETLREADADVVFLQETNAEWERELRAGLSDRYPSMVFVDRRAAGGMAVLARSAITEQEVLEPPAEGWFPALRVVLDTPVGEVQFVGVHLHPQISDSGSVVSGYFFTGGHRLAEIDQYLATLDTRRPTVLLGDFNEDAGGAALQHLAEAGYHSALDDFEPGRHTWRWATSVGSISFQLDHIVHDAQLTPIDVHAVEAGRSDHIPVLGVFVRSPTPLAPHAS